MEEKFIDGTNEQYSIREDGVIISHYRIRHSPLHDKYYILENKREMTPDENHSVTIFKKKHNVKKLLLKYFGYVFCKQCHCKSEIYLNKGICKKCIKANKRTWKKMYLFENAEEYKQKRKRYVENNPKAYSEMSKRATKKAAINLTRYYVASSLNIRVKNLSEELYEHHKALILFKRKLSEELKINIEKLN